MGMILVELKKGEKTKVTIVKYKHRRNETKVESAFPQRLPQLPKRKE